MNCRNGLAEQKTPASVPDIENDSPLAGLKEIRPHPPAVVEHRNSPDVCVRVDIAGPQFFQNELFKRPLRAESAEVDHHGYVSQLPGFDCALNRCPVWSLIMRRLHADDDVPITLCHLGRRLRVHVAGILLHCTASLPMPYDVQHHQDARARMIENARLLLWKILPARGSGVHHRGYARAEGVAISPTILILRQ